MAVQDDGCVTFHPSLKEARNTKGETKMKCIRNQNQPVTMRCLGWNFIMCLRILSFLENSSLGHVGQR